MNTFKALLKREFWEHNGTMLISLAVIAIILAILMIVGLFFVNSISKGVAVGNLSLIEAINFPIESINVLSNEKRSMLISSILYLPIFIFLLFFILKSISYTLSNLYNEKVDRSILFWKSLPISDTQTILSKFVTVILIMPIICVGFVILFQIYMLIFATILSWFNGGTGGSLWDISTLFSVVFNTLTSFLVWSIYLSPFWAWFMLVSAWAEKKPGLWAVSPVILIVVAEDLILQSNFFLKMIGDYIINGASLGGLNVIKSIKYRESVMLFDTSSPLEIMTQINFWTGIAVAAIFLTGAIYIRRFRNES